MSNEIDDEKNQRNNSASLQDYEIEVNEPERKGFFAKIIDRIKSANDTKLLDSGNKETFQKTNRSISSMWTVASLRRTIMEKLDSLNKALFSTPQKVDQSNITTHVIGRDDVKKDDLVQATEKVSTFEPVIPVAKSAQLRSERIIPKPVNIIGNSKSAKDVEAERETEGLKLESIEVEEEAIDKNVDEKINREQQAPEFPEEVMAPIEAGDISIGGPSKDNKSREDEDERE